MSTTGGGRRKRGKGEVWENEIDQIVLLKCLHVKTSNPHLYKLKCNNKKGGNVQCRQICGEEVIIARAAEKREWLGLLRASFVQEIVLQLY